ncbi:hypothetical protein FQZ97_412900 [compost metagenome]
MWEIVTRCCFGCDSPVLLRAAKVEVAQKHHQVSQKHKRIMRGANRETVASGMLAARRSLVGRQPRTTPAQRWAAASRASSKKLYRPPAIGTMHGVEVRAGAPDFEACSLDAPIPSDLKR